MKTLIGWTHFIQRDFAFSPLYDILIHLLVSMYNIKRMITKKLRSINSPNWTINKMSGIVFENAIIQVFLCNLNKNEFNLFTFQMNIVFMKFFKQYRKKNWKKCRRSNFIFQFFTINRNYIQNNFVSVTRISWFKSAITIEIFKPENTSNDCWGSAHCAIHGQNEDIRAHKLKFEPRIFLYLE